MWSLKIPLIKAAGSYKACVATSTTTGDRRKNLLNASDTVRKAGQRLRQATSGKSLHDLDDKQFSIPGIDAEHFVQWVYGNGMNTVAAYKIRGQLMAAPPNERCPLCRQGTVYQLDHFMPKSLFPALCVDPLNLVPVCERCNLIKETGGPNNWRTPSCIPTSTGYPMSGGSMPVPPMMARWCDWSSSSLLQPAGMPPSLLGLPTISSSLN